MVKTSGGFNLFPHTIMAPETFEALPEIEAKPEALFHGASGKLYRTRLDVPGGGSKWHVVCWASVEGKPTAIASRVDTRMYRRED